MLLPEKKQGVREDAPRHLNKASIMARIGTGAEKL